MVLSIAHVRFYYIGMCVAFHDFVTVRPGERIIFTLNRARSSAALVSDPGAAILALSVGLGRISHVGRSAVLAIRSSRSAAGGVCAISHQDQYREVFSSQNPRRYHRRPGRAPAVGFGGASRGSDRVHPGGVERSLRPQFQDIAFKPGSVLCTERRGCRNRSP